VRQELLAKNRNTITILAGDLFNPSAMGTARVDGERLNGRHIVDVMNVLGLDYATFGNHEFDLSEEQFLKRLSESIVMLAAADPVGAGFITSLGRPGGNITGLSTVQADLSVKWLELLKEAIPGVSRVTVLGDTTSAVTRAMAREKERASRAFGVRLHIPEVADPSALAPAFAAISSAQADAIMVLPSPRFHASHRRIVGLVARSQLLAIYPARWFVEAGGPMSYDRSRA
jgi:ABC-type uncharacterized transport system substrate-binding protein